MTTARRVGYLRSEANAAASDRSVDEYNKIAVMLTPRTRLPASIQEARQRPALIPPKSFTALRHPFDMACAQAYSEAARGRPYRTMASSEFSSFRLSSSRPSTRPIRAPSRKRWSTRSRAAMLQNLDTREAPCILRCACGADRSPRRHPGRRRNACGTAAGARRHAESPRRRAPAVPSSTPPRAWPASPRRPPPSAARTRSGDTGRHQRHHHARIALDPEIQKRVTSADRTPQRNSRLAAPKTQLTSSRRHLPSTSALRRHDRRAEEGAGHSGPEPDPNLRGLGFYDDRIHIDTGRVLGIHGMGRGAGRRAERRAHLAGRADRRDRRYRPAATSRRSGRVALVGP